MTTGPAEGFPLGPVARLRARAKAGTLGVRDFRLLFIGQTVSSIGDQVFPVAVSLKILDAGGNEGDLGLVLAGRALALVLFLIVGGVVADRLRRTQVMIIADLMRVVAVLALALTPGDVPVWALALLTFGVGAGEAFFKPAYGAILPSVLPEERLAAGNALASVSFKSSLLLGPAIAAFLVHVGGPRTAFAFDAATFAISMLTLMRIAEPAAAPRQRESAVREAIAGVRAVRERPWVGAILVMALLQVMLTIAPYLVLLPVIARERLGGDGSYALVLTLFALGGLPGALLAGRWTPRRPGVWALAGLLPHAGLMLALLYSPSVGVVAAWAFVSGVGLEPFLVWWGSALQREIPRELLARVISVDWMISMGMLPVGLALTGPAVRMVGRGPVLWCAAITMVVTSAAPLLVRGVAEFRTPTTPAVPAVRLGRLRPREVPPRP